MTFVGDTGTNARAGFPARENRKNCARKARGAATLGRAAQRTRPAVRTSSLGMGVGSGFPHSARVSVAIDGHPFEPPNGSAPIQPKAEAVAVRSSGSARARRASTEGSFVSEASDRSVCCSFRRRCTERAARRSGDLRVVDGTAPARGACSVSRTSRASKLATYVRVERESCVRRREWAAGSSDARGLRANALPSHIESGELVLAGATAQRCNALRSFAALRTTSSPCRRGPSLSRRGSPAGP